MTYPGQAVNDTQIIYLFAWKVVFMRGLEPAVIRVKVKVFAVSTLWHFVKHLVH